MLRNIKYFYIDKILRNIKFFYIDKILNLKIKTLSK